MFKILKVFGLSVVSAGVCLLGGVADAATGRAAYENVRTGSFAGAAQGASTQRMPSMPTLPLIAVGNISTDVPVAPNNDVPNGGGNGGGDNPPGPDLPPNVTIQECPDGGVKNSAYTIDNCMRDVLACVNNGALPNGLNDMFNDDLRASIINGMGLCYNQVDKCITDVRRNCARVYGSRADVWIDFNSRKVQPEYYSFVLRKTGLTPVQAENTCLLLDKNVYGKSFAAVAGEGKVTAEYDQKIGAYNSQMDGMLSKDNPMGATVNTNGSVDSQRGHYARWDAATAECLIRVAAYNKDKQISNSWLFGAIGDDRPAEVWKVAGETFTCNKDLFGFSLMKDTATAALIGVGGGAVLGTGIGAAVGAGVANKNNGICAKKSYRDDLLTEIKKSGKAAMLSSFLSTDIKVTTNEISPELCAEIVELPGIYDEYNARVSVCEDALNGKLPGADGVTTAEVFSLSCKGDLYSCLGPLVDNSKSEWWKQVTKYQEKTPEEAKASAVALLNKCLSPVDGVSGVYTVKNQDCSVAQEVLKALGYTPLVLGQCTFKTLDKVTANFDRSIVCSAPGNTCRNYIDIRNQLNRLQEVLSVIDLNIVNESRGATIGKGAAIGAAVGAGAGGLATAITALVEHDNINCRVGDGLGQVGLNKSYSIDGLKDLYVKWNLNLPDTQVVGGGTTVRDLASWTDACKTYISEAACKDAQFYYKNAAGALEWVYSACEFDVAGATCNPSATLIKSYDVK